MAFKKGELIHKMELKHHLGERHLQELINFILHYIADLDIPVKRSLSIPISEITLLLISLIQQRDIHRISNRNVERQSHWSQLQL